MDLLLFLLFLKFQNLDIINQNCPHCWIPQEVNVKICFMGISFNWPFRVSVIPFNFMAFILSQASVTPHRHLFEGCHITQFGLAVTGHKSVRNLQALTTFSSTEHGGGGTCSERAVSVPRGSEWNDTGLIKSTGANGDPRCSCPWR